jgi:hypothetical protein
MNSTVLAKLKTKKEAYQRYLQTCSNADYNLYARARNQAKESCRTAVKTIGKNIAKIQKKTKAFLLYASSKCTIKDGISDLKVDQRKIYSDEGKANVLHQFFGSVFTEEDLNSNPAPRGLLY